MRAQAYERDCEVEAQQRAGQTPPPKPPPAHHACQTREDRLREALKHAVGIILSYQTDLRNSKGLCGITGNLADAGFCQGSVYREAIAKIHELAGEEIYP